MNSKRSILYIEDDEDDRELLLGIAKDVEPGMSIELAENGAEALEFLYLHEKDDSLPCLIILDINMPVLDGKETYKQIKKNNNLGDIPIIIFSSSHNPNDLALFRSLGVEFVSKPHGFEDVNKAVKYMLEKCCTKPLS